MDFDGNVRHTVRKSLFFICSLCRVDLSQCEFVVVLVVKDVHEVGVEGVDVLQFGEFAQNRLKLLGKVALGELDLAHVERPGERAAL